MRWASRLTPLPFQPASQALSALFSAVLSYFLLDNSRAASEVVSFPKVNSTGPQLLTQRTTKNGSGMSSMIPTHLA